MNDMSAGLLPDHGQEKVNDLNSSSHLFDFSIRVGELPW
jgi:hypothetical protein